MEKRFVGGSVDNEIETNLVYEIGLFYFGINSFYDYLNSGILKNTSEYKRYFLKEIFMEKLHIFPPVADGEPNAEKALKWDQETESFIQSMRKFSERFQLLRED